jgi:hypothetical protein
VIHSSLYLPEPVYEVLRKIAFDERKKIHDLATEGIDAVLRRRGYPSIETLKAGKKRAQKNVGAREGGSGALGEVRQRKRLWPLGVATSRARGRGAYRYAV